MIRTSFFHCFAFITKDQIRNDRLLLQQSLKLHIVRNCNRYFSFIEIIKCISIQGKLHRRMAIYGKFIVSGQNVKDACSTVIVTNRNDYYFNTLFLRKARGERLVFSFVYGRCVHNAACARHWYELRKLPVKSNVEAVHLHTTLTV